jgi:hypothetical protein
MTGRIVIPVEIVAYVLREANGFIKFESKTKSE